MQNSISDIARLAGLLIAGLLFSLNPEAKGQKAKGSGATESPNILFILTDDQGWADLSGPLDPGHPEAFCSYFHTPNINRLCRQGMRFTDGYAPAPLCTPTRRSIQWGMTPARQHGTEFVGSFDPEGKWSVAQALKEANPGYRCAHFGKWGGVITGTFGDQESQMPGHPGNNGYDAHDGLSGNETGTFYPNNHGMRDYNTICLADADPKRTPSLTRRSIDFIKEQVSQGSPFYLQVSYYAIHTAFQATRETMDRYAVKTKPGRLVPPGIGPMLEELDAAIGQLLNTLDELGIRKNTYIFFMADNGGEHANRIWDSHYGYTPGFIQRSKLVDSRPDRDSEPVDRNHPLNRCKQWLYEGGIRVPFAARGPGIESGSVCRVPVTGCDLLPTFYDLAGGKKPLPQKIDGGSLRNLLENAGRGTIERPVEGLVFHRPDPPGEGIPAHSAYRLGNFKLILYWSSEGRIIRRELYDLSSDIGEKNNLSGKMPEKADELQDKLLQYLREVDNQPGRTAITTNQSLKSC